MTLAPEAQAFMHAADHSAGFVGSGAITDFAAWSDHALLAFGACHASRSMHEHTARVHARSHTWPVAFGGPQCIQGCKRPSVMAEEVSSRAKWASGIVALALNTTKVSVAPDCPAVPARSLQQYLRVRACVYASMCARIRAYACVLVRVHACMRARRWAVGRAGGLASRQAVIPPQECMRTCNRDCVNRCMHARW